MQIPPLVPLAAFTATGDLARLKDALHQALDAGLTIEQAKEAMVQLYAYCGFPRSLNALGVLMQTVQERRARGCHDADGRAATPLPPGADAVIGLFSVLLGATLTRNLLLRRAVLRRAPEVFA